MKRENINFEWKLKSYLHLSRFELRFHFGGYTRRKVEPRSSPSWGVECARSTRGGPAHPAAPSPLLVRCHRAPLPCPAFTRQRLKFYKIEGLHCSMQVLL